MFYKRYLTIGSLFGVSVLHSPKTAGGHVLCLALGLFLVIIVSSYTASLATLLTTSALSTAVKDIEDVKARALTVCVQASVERIFKALYPGIPVLSFVSYEDLFFAIEKQECAAGVVGSITIDSANQGCC